MTAAAIDLEGARRHAEETVKRSGTSFGPGMRILSKPRREGMYAVYAFCREVDDIADEEGPLEEKRAGLAEWRAEIDRVFEGRPQTPAGAALIEPVRRFHLSRDEFILVIEGMEMDAEGPIVAPPLERLYAYTRRAAGAVGMLSMPVFGAPDGAASEDFALSLGDALQLTNILRDVEEDAQEGRLYLPRELLEKHGCPLDPPAVVSHPGLPAVRADLSAIAREKFAAARRALREGADKGVGAGLDWRTLRPALLMMGVYETYLNRMTARGWANGQPKVKLSKLEKALIALRWFVAPRLAAG